MAGEPREGDSTVFGAPLTDWRDSWYAMYNRLLLAAMYEQATPPWLPHNNRPPALCPASPANGVEVQWWHRLPLAEPVLQFPADSYSLQIRRLRRHLVAQAHASRDPVFMGFADAWLGDPMDDVRTQVAELWPEFTATAPAVVDYRPTLPAYNPYAYYKEEPWESPSRPATS